MTDAANHMLHGDVQSPADAERDVAHEVSDHIGGRVVVTIAQHGADGAETVTAGDQARLDATHAHLAKSDRGGETVAQQLRSTVAAARRGRGDGWRRPRPSHPGSAAAVWRR